MKAWFFVIAIGVFGCGRRDQSDALASKERAGPPNAIEVDFQISGLAASTSGALFLTERTATRPWFYVTQPPFERVQKIYSVGQRAVIMDWRVGKVLACDLATSEVLEFRDQFQLLHSWRVPLVVAAARSAGSKIVAVAGDGAVYSLVGTRQRVLFAGLERPVDIEFADENSVWITEEGQSPGSPRVSRWSLDGVVLNSIVANWVKPAGIATGPRGEVWITDVGSRRLYRFEQSILRTVVQGTQQIEWVTILPDGRVAYTENVVPGSRIHFLEYAR